MMKMKNEGEKIDEEQDKDEDEKIDEEQDEE